MARPASTRNKNALAIYRASEPVRYAREYLRTGHTDLALENLRLSIEALEDLAGGEVQTLRLAQRYLLDGMMEVGRDWLEKGIEQLGEIANDYTMRGKERFEASEAERYTKAEQGYEEAKMMIRRKSNAN